MSKDSDINDLIGEVDSLTSERDQLRADRAALLEQLRLLVGHLDDDLPVNLARVREFITEMESSP